MIKTCIVAKEANKIEEDGTSALKAYLIDVDEDPKVNMEHSTMAATDDASIWVNYMTHYSSISNTDDMLMLETFKDLFLIHDFFYCVVNFIDIVILHKLERNCLIWLMDAHSKPYDTWVTIPQLMMDLIFVVEYWIFSNCVKIHFPKFYWFI